MDHDYAAAQLPDEPYIGVLDVLRVPTNRSQDINNYAAPIIENEDIFLDLEQTDEETQQPPDVDADDVIFVDPQPENNVDIRNNMPPDPDDRPGTSTSSQSTVTTAPTSYSSTHSIVRSTSSSTSTVTSTTTTERYTIANPNSISIGLSVTEHINVTPVTPSPGKKRKRVSSGGAHSATPKLKALGNSKDAEDEDDEGLICPICLDAWEMSGPHRLVSLRCGHLFGDVCIRRWLSESARQSGVKMCPQCKTKAAAKDIRFLYARRLRAIDRSEEHQLREQLEDERKHVHTLKTELSTLKMTNALNKNRIEALEQDNDRMKSLLRFGNSLLGYKGDTNSNILSQLQQHKLYLERNIEISREPGCRVMIYAEQHSAVIVSQKSSQSLFPGFGVRFIDTTTFRTSHFMHVSLKLLRDVCLSADQQSLVVTSMETRSKLFDLRMRQFAKQFTPGNTPLWSCAMDRNDREQYLYLGGQHGATYVYDIRYPSEIFKEYATADDTSPIIQVSTVQASKLFPSGGFLVCSLRALYFYEYNCDGVISTRLNVEGPFISMSYSDITEMILISTRCSPNYPQSRYIVGNLDKVDDTTVLNVKISFYGSKTTPVMTRPTQIAVEVNTLIAGYVQDVKLLSLYDVRRETRLQSVPVQETVFDTCPIYTADATYVAALTENKCRIYKVSAIN